MHSLILADPDTGRHGPVTWRDLSRALDIPSDSVSHVYLSTTSRALPSGEGDEEGPAQLQAGVEEPGVWYCRSGTRLPPAAGDRTGAEPTSSPPSIFQPQASYLILTSSGFCAAGVCKPEALQSQLLLPDLPREGFDVGWGGGGTPEEQLRCLQEGPADTSPLVHCWDACLPHVAQDFKGPQACL